MYLNLILFLLLFVHCNFVHSQDKQIIGKWTEYDYSSYDGSLSDSIDFHIYESGRYYMFMWTASIMDKGRWYINPYSHEFVKIPNEVLKDSKKYEIKKIPNENNSAVIFNYKLFDDTLLLIYNKYTSIFNRNGLMHNIEK